MAKDDIHAGTLPALSIAHAIASRRCGIKASFRLRVSFVWSRMLPTFWPAPVFAVFAADEAVGFFVAEDLLFRGVEAQGAAQTGGNVAKVAERG